MAMAIVVSQETNTVLIKVTIQEDGSNVDLDGATDINGNAGGTFVLLNSDGTKRVSKVGSIGEPVSGGEVSLRLAAEDLDSAGTWYVQVGFTLGSFVGWTEPKEFRVNPNLRQTAWQSP